MQSFRPGVVWLVTKGGPRNRGRLPEEGSARSERAALVYRLLPRQGFTGRVPAFPLPAPTAREREFWKQIWRTPQAAMWSDERWRMHTVGLFCRWSVRAEGADATSAVLAQVHRLADQVGLTPAGLKENGWRIARDEVAAQRSESGERVQKTSSGPLPRRMRAVASLDAIRLDKEG